MRHAEFRDPRLVTVYDAECPWSRDDEFFLSIVNETPAARVLDLGCGTGRLALGMAAARHMVTGLDPAPASLNAARAKPGAEHVTWINGTSPHVPDASFHVAVMTSHVAQFFVDDHEWKATLADLKRSLVPNGRLVFDTRDPRAREWERWNPSDSLRQIRLPDRRVVTAWTEVSGASAGAVSGGLVYAAESSAEDWTAFKTVHADHRHLVTPRSWPGTLMSQKIVAISERGLTRRDRFVKLGQWKRLYAAASEQLRSRRKLPRQPAV